MVTTAGTLPAPGNARDVMTSTPTQPAAVAAWSPWEKSLAELQAAMEGGRTSAQALVEYYLARIDALDGGAEGLNAIATVNDAARATAALLDAERRERGSRGPLHGIPLVLKDNIHTTDLPTTAGSELLKGFVAVDDAAIVERLRAAGAIVLAKANMHEWALGITNAGSGFGTTRNPYASDRNPGGSSGGVAAAVTANFAAAGVGTDTCGSIRIPAAHNDLVGLRATQGLISRRGLVPLSHTQDIAGPLARSVTDAALLLEVLAGVDPADPQTAESYGRPPEAYTEYLTPVALNGARIGLLEELLLVEPADAEVAEVVGRAAAELQSLGAVVQRVALPEFHEIVAPPFEGLFVLVYEFKRDIDNYFATNPGVPVRSLGDLLASGIYHPGVEAALKASEATGNRNRREYLEALLDRERLRQHVLALMARERLDALVYPSVRRVAMPLGDDQPGNNCALSANTGLPALTLPAGFTADGLPVGMELLGVPWSEARLLGFGYAYEQTHRQRVPPPLPGDPVVYVTTSAPTRQAGSTE
jgi:Asp-tRNA(Asn)/Glu-tRNA(Gln) amidotransferase A subunit family amidase